MPDVGYYTLLYIYIIENFHTVPNVYRGVIGSDRLLVQQASDREFDS